MKFIFFGHFAAPLFVAAAIVLTGCSSQTPVGAAGPPPAPVTVATVVQRTAPIDVQVVGNVEAYETVSVKSQIGGILDHVFIREGDFVTKKQKLFTIDRRPWDAAVKQAEANIAHDRAALRQAEANLRRDVAQEDFARKQAERYQQLYERKAVAKQDVEQFTTDAEAEHETVAADEAAIATAKAAIDADQAALDSTNIQLSYTEIDSPVDGRLGNLNVKEGNVVKATDIELITINRLQPIYVTFALPEDRLAEVRTRLTAGQKLPVIANPEESDAGAETGDLTFIDNSVDPATGAIKLKGTFPNTDKKLWPGKFVRVTLRLGILQNAIVVPTQAVQTGQDGEYVFVVKLPDRTVETRPVVTGVRVNSDQVIQKGLAPGEIVVKEGHVRLVTGSHVLIKKQSGTGD